MPRFSVVKNLAEENQYPAKIWISKGGQNKVKFSIDMGCCALVLVGIAFVSIKILSPVFGRYLGIIIAALAVVMFLKFPKLKAGWLSIGALSLDDLMLGISISFFLVYYLLKCVHEKRMSRVALVVILSCITLLMMNLFTGGVMIDNLTRFLAMLIPLLLIAVLLPSLKFNQDRGISLVYYVLISGQIVFLSLDSSDRMSIFNGSENIAFIIFSVMMYLVFITSRTLFPKISAALIFFLFVSMTDSRTGLFLSIFLFGWLFSRSMSINVIKVYLFSLIILAYLFGGYLDIARDSYLRYVSVVDFLLAGDIGFDSLASLDVRGDVFAEGLNVWHQNPFFGVGAYPSIVLQDLFGGGATHEFHNLFIDILVQYGLVGFILVFLNYLLILGKIYPRLSPFARRDVLFLLVFYLLFAMFQPLVFNYQALIILFASIACVSVSDQYKN
jgi:O-antigen ligase